MLDIRYLKRSRLKDNALISFTISNILLVSQSILNISLNAISKYYNSNIYLERYKDVTV